jgi:hypothetical protein
MVINFATSPANHVTGERDPLTFWPKLQREVVMFGSFDAHRTVTG